MYDLVTKYYYPSIFGRYVVLEDLDLFYNSLSKDFKIEIQGESVLGKPIKSVEIGNGQTKILMWSQMHGNESTTTKSVVDLLNFLNSEDTLANQFKRHYTLLIIPMLNPDGAKSYTRVNANQVDLNRDSVDLTQPESRTLRKVFDNFKPNYAFNLHDQRTIFSAGNTSNPATISFLAPSYNIERDINDTRLEAMQLIVAMNRELQKHIPNQVGRFDDSFNLNCTGDCFQYLGVPTILFEAGHFPKDYRREETRKVVFMALITVLRAILEGKYKNIEMNEYLNIPENSKLFTDIEFSNVIRKEGDLNKSDYVRVQYQELLDKGEIIFVPKITSINKFQDLPAHLTIGESLKWKVDSHIVENEVIDKNVIELIDLDLNLVNILLNK